MQKTHFRFSHFYSSYLLEPRPICAACRAVRLTNIHFEWAFRDALSIESDIYGVCTDGRWVVNHGVGAIFVVFDFHRDLFSIVVNHSYIDITIAGFFSEDCKFCGYTYKDNHSKVNIERNGFRKLLRRARGTDFGNMSLLSLP